MAEHQTDWVTPVAVVGGAALLSVGAWMVLKPKSAAGKPSALVIKSYKNMRTGETAPAGTKLGAKNGDTVRVTFAYDYQGPVNNITYTAAIFIGPVRYGEGVGGEELANTPSKQTLTREIDVVVAAVFVGEYRDFNLYVRAETQEGKTDANQYNVIRVAPFIDPTGPNITNFRITSFPAEIPNGETMNVQVGMDYQGPAATIALRVALGRMRALVFDEYIYNQINVNLPASTQSAPQTFTIPILVNLAPENSPYTLEAKVAMLVPITDRKVDAITVSGPPSTHQLQNVQVYNYPAQLTAGEPCHIGVYFEYKGPAHSVRVHGAIGHFLLGAFMQDRGADLDVSMAALEDWTPALVDVAVPTNGLDGLYSLRATVGEQADLKRDVLRISPQPTYGTFYIELVGETGFYYTEYLAVWEAGGIAYSGRRTAFGDVALIASFPDSVPEPVLLTGRLTVYLKDGFSGNVRTIGPSAVYTVLNGETYQFNCNTLDLWRV